MPEALARVRREPTLSVPTREIARQASRIVGAASTRTRLGRKWRIWTPSSVGGYVAILMAIALAGVVVNAVGLQRERHPAPLFAPEPATQAASAPSPKSVAPAPDNATSTPKPEASAPAAAKPTAPSQPSVARKTDPIGEWIRTGASPDPAKTVASAQRALVKLGYDLQADGLMGASTVEALHDFEKAHGLPASSELSPRLIARLNGAVR